MISFLKLFTCLFLTNTFVVNQKTIEVVNSNSFYYYDESYLYDDQISIYLNGDKLTNGIIIDAVKQDESYYFIKEIGGRYFLDIYNSMLEEIELDFIPKELKVTDKIFMIGCKENDSHIEKRNLKGDLLDIVTLGGEGYESYDHLIVTDKYLYVSGTKDAVSIDNAFLNVGQEGEIKSFVVKLDKGLDIIDTIYLNNKLNKEIITSFNLSDNLTIVLNDSIVYQCDKDLKNLTRLKNELDTMKNQFINDFVYISYDKNLMINSLVQKGLFKITENEKPIYIKLNNGALRVITKTDSYINIYDILEYTFNKKDPLILYHDRYVLESTDNIVVTSIFDNVEVKFIKVDGYFEHRVSGTYKGIYQLKFSNDIIVPNYVNIIDDGIYNKNLTLDFFGTATLDGEPIYNGYSPNVGNHILILTDNIGNESVYKFNVVEDYYKENTNQYIKADICLNKGSSASITYSINKPIKDIIINGESYSNYSFSSNQLIIIFNANELDLVDYYLIEKIIFDDEELILNDLYIIRTMKDNITINPNYIIEKNNIYSTFDINDLDHSFMYLKATLTYNDKTQEDYIFKGEQSKFNLNDKGHLLISFCYDLGDGIIIEEPLIDVNLDETNLQIDYRFNYNETCLNQIQIDFKLNNIKHDISDLKIAKQNISFINVNNSINPFLKVIIIISICLLFIGGGIGTAMLLYLRHRKIKL